MADIGKRRTIHPANDRDPTTIDTMRKIADEAIRQNLQPAPVLVSTQRRSEHSAPDSTTDGEFKHFYSTNSDVLNIDAGQFCDGIRTTFDLVDEPLPTQVVVYRNGQHLRIGAGYSVSGNTITIIANGAPGTTEELTGFYWT